MSYAPYRAKILFVQSLRGCDFFKPEKNKSLRRYAKKQQKGKLPRKRQFTPVLHRKRHTRRSFIRSFCVYLDGGGKGIRTRHKSKNHKKTIQKNYSQFLSICPVSLSKTLPDLLPIYQQKPADLRRVFSYT